jgi:hypothetical protein
MCTFSMTPVLRILPIAPVFMACFYSCAEQPGDPTIDGSISQTSVADTCDCNMLVTDSTGLHTLSDTTFTGVCLSYYDGSDQKYLEKNLLQGRLHGKVTYFDREGEILLEEMYENGAQKRTGSPGENMTCNCAELEFVKTNDPNYPTVAKLDDIPFTGRCEEKYPDSDQLSLESNYNKGVLNGYTVYYNRDGSTILMEHYENGVLVSTVN